MKKTKSMIFFHMIQEKLEHLSLIYYHFIYSYFRPIFFMHCFQFHDLLR